jgi:GPH family glycoside/pentoside/hexuronide:cation symporter
MIIFLVQYVLGKDKPGTWMLYFSLTASAVQIALIPWWIQLSQKIEKQKTYILATVIFCLASLSWLIATPDEALWLFLLRAAIKGFAAGGLLLMGQSMLPDTIAYDFKRTGLRREGVFSGLYSLVEKVASAFAPSLLLLGYAFFGFDSKAPSMSQETVDGIRYCAAWLPCFYFGLSLIPLYFYRLTEKELNTTRHARA